MLKANKTQISLIVRWVIAQHIHSLLITFSKATWLNKTNKLKKYIYYTNEWKGETPSALRSAQLRRLKKGNISTVSLKYLPWRSREAQRNREKKVSEANWKMRKKINTQKKNSSLARARSNKLCAARRITNEKTNYCRCFRMFYEIIVKKLTRHAFELRLILSGCDISSLRRLLYCAMQ